MMLETKVQEGTGDRQSYKCRIFNLRLLSPESLVYRFGAAVNL